MTGPEVAVGPVWHASDRGGTAQIRVLQPPFMGDNTTQYSHRDLGRSPSLDSDHASAGISCGFQTLEGCGTPVCCTVQMRGRTGTSRHSQNRFILLSLAICMPVLVG